MGRTYRVDRDVRFSSRYGGVVDASDTAQSIAPGDRRITIVAELPAAPKVKPGVTVKVRLGKEQPGEFKIPKDKPFKKLWKAVLANMSGSITRLEIDGEVIASVKEISEETPDSLDLEDGDLIDAFE